MENLNPVVSFTLAELRAGDDAAWEKAYVYFYNFIINVLRTVVYWLTREDLDDIALVAIQKLINKYVHEVQEVDELTKLAITTAKNEAHDLEDQRRAAKRGGGKVESLEAQPEHQDYEADVLDPAQAAAQAELNAVVLSALDRVPQKYRDVLADYYFLGLKQREIAEKRGLKIGTIGVYITRGLEALEPILAENISL